MSQLPRRIRPEFISIGAVSAMLRRLGGRLGARAAEVCDKRLQPLPASATVAEAIEAMARQRQHVVPVVDHGGRVLGVVDASMLESYLRGAQRLARAARSPQGRGVEKTL